MTDLLVIACVAGLATWRLASLLHTEDAFEWLRKWIKIGHDENGYPAIYPDTFWGKVFDCFWCLTLMASAVVVPFVCAVARVRAVWWAVIWLASGTVAIWTEKQVMRAQSR